MKETTYYAVTKVRKDQGNGEGDVKLKHLKIFETKDKAKAEAAKLRKNRNISTRQAGYTYIVSTLRGNEGFEVAKQIRYDEMYSSLLQEAEYVGPAMAAFARKLLETYPLTYDDLYYCNFDDAEIKTSAEEFISRSTSASVWTEYVEGTIRLNGVDYIVDKTQFNSQVTRV